MKPKTKGSIESAFNSLQRRLDRCGLPSIPSGRPERVAQARYTLSRIATIRQAQDSLTAAIRFPDSREFWLRQAQHLISIALKTP